MGDMNAYMEEDPIYELETELVNLLEIYDEDGWSYQFFPSFAWPFAGRGNLDHAFRDLGRFLQGGLEPRLGTSMPMNPGTSTGSIPRRWRQTASGRRTTIRSLSAWQRPALTSRISPRAYSLRTSCSSQLWG